MATPRLLITAGPTHEPIDAVRFIGNRSSGRVGVAIADEAARLGWSVTLLLGPVHLRPSDPGVLVRRFVTCEDLRGLLGEAAGGADVVIMAAAVADYRPKKDTVLTGGKFRRTEGPLTLELESTPDLIAEVAARRRPGQVLVAFALGPAAEVESSARQKLVKKGVDLVVGNPLETMDSDRIEAVVVDREGGEHRTAGAVAKDAFAGWLLGLVNERVRDERATE